MIAVLGAGIQGTCAALALAAKRHRVTLIDQMPQPLMRASLRNEGKVHLGFIYANDPSFRSAELMLEAGLSFAPLIDTWMPSPIDWSKLRSAPFTYLIMRDSIVAADDLRSHYERMTKSYRERLGDHENYLGTRPDRLWRTVAAPSFANEELVESAVETGELAVDVGRLRNHITAALEAEERIDWRPGKRVETVSRASSGFAIGGRDRHGGASWKVRADVVVNCLWDGRLAIDEQLGTPPQRSWVHRLKYRVIGSLPPRLHGLPSLTMTLGPYGDVVPLGESSYFSWYPLCRRGWSHELETPPAWEDACNGVVDESLKASLSREVFETLDRIVPGIGDSRVTSVDAGVVFSWGETDIDNIDSGLHERFAVGVHGDDGYYSVDTGKLTCAPLFASRLAEHI